MSGDIVTLGGSVARFVDGRNIDTVDIEIDYAILQHFSKHLYSSPNKAIEELVTNGYDALAQRVDIFLPHLSSQDCLIVWDDGESMDLTGLKRLWWIARSPKQQVVDRLAVSRDGMTRRLMIGKFGIGKLASYAVGNLISHICRQDDRYLLVTVNYALAPHLDDVPSTGDTVRKLSAPVLELDAATAKAFVSGLFRRPPDDFDAMWNKPSWTIAIIDELREDVQITPGRLSWVLSMGMPLRPDFAVRVNGDAVSPRVMKDAEVTWTPTDLRDALERAWADAVNAGKVTGSLIFGSSTVTLPQLGEAGITLRMFSRSLLHSNRTEEGRSHGFFVMVRDRLLNPDDALLYLSQSSFETLYRMQAVISADGLDVDLLADRERLQILTPRTSELAVLQRGIYSAARAFVERKDEEASQARESWPLPTDSREFYRQPLSAAALRRPGPAGAR
ncbi:ATP-binding protein, partial [Actinoplanes sp. NPDC051633]|uniref:ATP-binding protein n=1 Tax=Actinoplanes sp. NPDC051633 TaxID=3155670 RepID=UPI00343C08CE